MFELSSVEIEVTEDGYEVTEYEDVKRGLRGLIGWCVLEGRSGDPRPANQRLANQAIPKHSMNLIGDSVWYLSKGLFS